MPKLIDNDLELLAQDCADDDLAEEIPAMMRHLDERQTILVARRAFEIMRRNEK